jgi:hypothetical protein
MIALAAKRCSSAVARAFQRVKTGTNFLTIFMLRKAHPTVASTRSRNRGIPWERGPLARMFADAGGMLALAGLYSSGPERPRTPPTRFSVISPPEIDWRAIARSS